MAVRSGVPLKISIFWAEAPGLPPRTNISNEQAGKKFPSFNPTIYHRVKSIYYWKAKHWGDLLEDIWYVVFVKWKLHWCYLAMYISSWSFSPEWCQTKVKITWGEKPINDFRPFLPSFTKLYLALANFFSINQIAWKQCLTNCNLAAKQVPEVVNLWNRILSYASE